VCFRLRTESVLSREDLESGDDLENDFYSSLRQVLESGDGLENGYHSSDRRISLFELKNRSGKVLARFSTNSVLPCSADHSGFVLCDQTSVLHRVHPRFDKMYF
jgi:hypothetical protein